MRLQIPNKFKVVALTTGLLFLLGIVALGLTFLFSIRSDTSTQTGCTSSGANYKIVIQNDAASPNNVAGNLCDTITITNLDSRPFTIAFGPHEHHVAYDGISERMLMKDQSLTFKLVKKGDFKFHDHIRNDVGGTFSVH